MHVLIFLESPLGGECETVLMCLDDNTICDNDTCVCAPGHYNNNGTCEVGQYKWIEIFDFICGLK